MNALLEKEIKRIKAQTILLSEEQQCNIINDYLKQTVSDIPYEERDDKYSTPFSALIIKKANSLGFINAFKLILDELNINSSIDSIILKENSYSLFFLTVFLKNTGIKLYSPYSEKICNRNLIPHDAWLKSQMN